MSANNLVDNSATIADNARMARKRTKVSDQLRQLIRGSGVSAYRIAKDTGVSTAALSRFLSGERGLSHKALDALGDYFGWEVTAKGPRRS